MQNIAIWALSHHFVALLCSQLRHVSTVRKNLLNSDIYSRCPHNMVNFGPLSAQIGSGVWGTSENFNGFRILSSLLQRRRSLEANQTLHDVWPSLALVHYIYIFGGSCPLTEFCQVENSLCIQVLHSSLLAALLHGTLAAEVSQNLRQGMELRNFRCGATYIQLGGRHVGHRPTL